MEELIIESGADDYFTDDETVVVRTAWQELSRVGIFLRSKNLNILSSGGEYVPTSNLEVTEFDKALKVHTLIETLEEDEDVESVWHNAIIPADLQKQILEHIESHRFRT